MKWSILLLLALSFIVFGCATAPDGEKAAPPESTAAEDTGGGAATETAIAATESAEEVTEYQLASISSYLANGVLDTVTKMVYLDGLLVEEQTFFGDGSSAGRVKHTYGERRVVLSEKTDRFGELLSSHTYGYDKRGRLVGEELLDADGNLIYGYRYTYDPQGRKNRWEILSDDGFVLGFAEYIYEDGRNTRVEMFDAAGDLREILERTFDAAGNPILELITDIDNNELEKTRYTYVDGQLSEKETYVRTRKIGSEQYEYNEEGNLVTSVRYDRTGQVIETKEYSYVEVAK